MGYHLSGIPSLAAYASLREKIRSPLKDTYDLRRFVSNEFGRPSPRSGPKSAAQVIASHFFSRIFHPIEPPPRCVPSQTPVWAPRSTGVVPGAFGARLLRGVLGCAESSAERSVAPRGASRGPINGASGPNGHFVPSCRSASPTLGHFVANPTGEVRRTDPYVRVTSYGD